MKKRLIIALSTLFLLCGCKKYLDVVPDNIATIDNAFTLRTEAQKFLFTCYSYLPSSADPQLNVGFLGGDEIWFPTQYREYNSVIYSWQIARGYQNVNTPYENYWDGEYYGVDCYEAIRQCNIFLENVSDLSKVPDLTLDERNRWLAEVTFLKAYYHFLLLRQYGAIPLVDKNLPISASPNEVKVSRIPFDSCVSYISTLLDSSVNHLPNIISDRSNELGRITQPIALAVKAKLYLLAASPLFNGNNDLTSVKNLDGTALFNASYDQNKWKKASDACLAAIQSAESNGFSLYEFPASSFKLKPKTMTQLSIRQAVCDRWNSEKIWGNSNSLAYSLQQTCAPRLSSDAASNTYLRALFSATLKMAELFYTKNGVPLDQDKTLDFTNKYDLRTAADSDYLNMEPGYQTARLNFDREERFYADLGFDGGAWYLYSSPTQSDSGTFVLHAKANQYGGSDIGGGINQTGYFIKKLIDWNFSFTSSGVTFRSYEWPEVRLADLYLMYAEALNEFSGPSEEVYLYINRIRNRAGLGSVQDCWTKYSNNPVQYTTQSGLRSIIKQERGIELMFEGSRFWDLRRWKDAATAYNQSVKGWTVTGQNAYSYYQVRTLYSQSFIAPRDYLWPIKIYNLSVNPNLVQNPGW